MQIFEDKMTDLEINKLIAEKIMGWRIDIVNEKPVASPFKIKLMPYFIRRMIRKRISYVEDSFQTPSQESMILIKPFLKF